MRLLILITICFCLFSPLKSEAQNNALFPVKDFFFNESHSWKSTPNPFLSDFENGSLFTKDSYTHNNKTYYRLYFNYSYNYNTGSSGQTSSGFSQKFVGDLNYDTAHNKVYLNDELLYDFSLKEGDIYPLTTQYTSLDSNIRVLNIDTLLDPYNISRKIFYIGYISSANNCNFHGSSTCAVIVEGIGNLKGILAPLFDCFEDCSNSLNCGKINNNSYSFNNGVEIGSCTFNGNKNLSSSFPDNNYFYNEAQYHTRFEMLPMDVFYYTVYHKKDTLINNTLHQVLNMRYKTHFYNGPLPDIQGDIPIAILRNDKANKKVYIKKFGFAYWNFYIPKDSSEKLLYDFSLKVGDYYTPNASYRVNITDSLFVKKIDTIIDADNIKRAVYFIDTKDSSLLEKGIVVEGIGGRNGLFGSIYGVMDWSYYEDLFCYSINNYHYELNASNDYANINYSNYRCDTLLILSTENSKQKNIIIYPNPANNFLQFNINETSAEISIFNNMGVLIKHEITVENKIDINSLIPGIYYIHIKANGDMYSSKFVKIE